MKSSEFNTESESDAIPGAVSFKVTHQTDNNTSMIVPVWLASAESPRKEVLTYAMLDNQSDCTFVLEDLAKYVAKQSTPTKLKLTTMTSQSSVVETNSVPDLLIRGVNDNKRIKIASSYTRDYIPADISQIPTSESALKWPHLQHIADEMSALQDCKVGLSSSSYSQGNHSWSAR